MGNLLSNTKLTNQINDLTNQVTSLSSTNSGLTNYLNHLIPVSEYIAIIQNTGFTELSTNYYYYVKCNESDVNNIKFESTKINNNNFYGYYYNGNVYLNIPYFSSISEKLIIGSNIYTINNNITPDVKNVNPNISNNTLVITGTNFIKDFTVTVKKINTIDQISVENSIISYTSTSITLNITEGINSSYSYKVTVTNTNGLSGYNSSLRNVTGYSGPETGS
jgi:hypothetical protein